MAARLIKADTVQNPQELKDRGYKFLPKINSWYVPKVQKAEMPPAPQDLPKSVVKPPPPTVKSTANYIPDPVIVPEKKTGVTFIYSGDILATDYTKKDLFTLETGGGFLRHDQPVHENWDSVERFLMYMLYKNTLKGAEIRRAPTLVEARRIFNIDSLPAANSPKQLLINQKLAPIAGSAKNPNFYKDFEGLFFKATLAKINQNFDIKNELAFNSGQIITRAVYDQFGYVGNLLGDTLISIRDGHSQIQRGPPTNNLVIERYSPELYVVRGNPTPDIAETLRTLGSFKTKSGATIKGKHSPHLQATARWPYHSDGWLIPKAAGRAAKNLVLETLPVQTQTQQILEKWIRDKLKFYLLPALHYSRLLGHQEIELDDIKKIVADFFGSAIPPGLANVRRSGTEPSPVVPPTIFVNAAIKIGKNVSEPTIQLLWDHISKEYTDTFNNNVNLETLKDILANQNVQAFESELAGIDNLTVRESIVVKPFCRIYKLLHRQMPMTDESHLTMVAITIITSPETFQQIRKVYTEKVKLPAAELKKTKGATESFENQLIFRFKIKTPHIARILELLPKQLSKKSKLLVLTMIDYICRPAVDSLENHLTIEKKLIQLSKIPMPDPTPEPPRIETSDYLLSPSPGGKGTASGDFGSPKQDRKTPTPKPTKEKTPTPKPKRSSPSPKPKKSTPTPTPPSKRTTRGSKPRPKVDVNQDSPTLEELMKRLD